MSQPYVGGGSYTVTKSDSANLPTSGVIFAEVSGDIKVTCDDGSVDTFVGVPAYQVLPVRVKQVWSTGTTATGIHCLTW